MKKIPGLFLLLGLLSCDDGDLQINTIDFDSASIESCNNPITAGTTLYFKLNTEEALILELESGLLLPEETTDPIQSTVPGQSQITYRSFSDDISSSYFCSSIPPGTPDVLLDVSAAAGEVLITTLRNETDTTQFNHTISLQELSFITESGERITDLTTIEYGTITISH